MLYTFRRPHPDLQIMKGTVEFDLFKRGVARFCYTENAFPNVEEERIACVTLAKRIVKWDDLGRLPSVDSVLLKEVIIML